MLEIVRRVSQYDCGALEGLDFFLLWPLDVVCVRGVGTNSSDLGRWDQVKSLLDEPGEKCKFLSAFEKTKSPGAQSLRGG